MENQKLVAAVIRVVYKDSQQKTIPIGFKIDKKHVPVDYVPLKIHRNNLIVLNIDKCKPLEAMLVAVGDDSKELAESYSCFCKRLSDNVKNKIPKYEEKIVHWLSNNDIKISKSSAGILNKSNEEDFDNFIRRANLLKRREKSMASKQDKNFPNVRSDTIDIGTSSDDDSDQDDNTDDPEYGLDKSQKPEVEDILDKKMFSSEQIHNNLEQIRLALGETPETVIKTFIPLVHEVLSYLVSAIETIENSDVYQAIVGEHEPMRFISEEDSTVEMAVDGHEKVILLEGIFPLKLGKYNFAIRQRVTNTKKEEIQSGPAAVLSNIVRYAFPEHWLVGVTLRGSNGKLSLINIWNHEDPLNENLEKQHTRTGLGESRLKALLDHCVRKCGRKSYDRKHEKFLTSILAKAMYHTRSKLEAEISSQKLKKEKNIPKNQSTVAKRIITPKPSTSNKEQEDEDNAFDKMEDDDLGDKRLDDEKSIESTLPARQNPIQSIGVEADDEDSLDKDVEIAISDEEDNYQSIFGDEGEDEKKSAVSESGASHVESGYIDAESIISTDEHVSSRKRRSDDSPIQPRKKSALSRMTDEEDFPLTQPISTAESSLSSALKKFIPEVKKNKVLPVFNNPLSYSPAPNYESNEDERSNDQRPKTIVQLTSSPKDKTLIASRPSTPVTITALSNSPKIIQRTSTPTKIQRIYSPTHHFSSSSNSRSGKYSPRKVPRTSTPIGSPKIHAGLNSPLKSASSDKQEFKSSSAGSSKSTKKAETIIEMVTDDDSLKNVSPAERLAVENIQANPRYYMRLLELAKIVVPGQPTSDKEQHSK